jgi:isocitrate dehydrogenase (NAD+)
MMERKHSIAVIPGDGVGPEVIHASLIVLRAVMEKDPQLKLDLKMGDVGEPAFEKYGDPFPEETQKLLRGSKAILFGAVGKFGREVILPLRQGFDLFANVRPAVTYTGIPSLKQNVDILIVRENTEDVYKGIGYTIDDDQYVALRIFTKKGMERIIRYAFGLAKREGRKSVLLAHKAPVVPYTDLPFLNLFKEISQEYSDIEAKDMLIDSCAMQVVLKPEMFDVILVSNMMGDILSDVAAGVIGGLGVAPSGNIGDKIAMFEPIHGSAPKYTGTHKINPIGAILSAKMMLDWLGEKEDASILHQAVSAVLREGKIRTFDLGGSSTTEEVASAIAQKIVG